MKRQWEGPSMPGRWDSMAKGPEVRQRARGSVCGVESGWGWLRPGPRSRETGGEAAAGAEGPPRASSGAWTLSPRAVKVFVCFATFKHIDFDSF